MARNLSNISEMHSNDIHVCDVGATVPGPHKALKTFFNITIIKNTREYNDPIYKIG